MLIGKEQEQFKENVLNHLFNKKDYQFMFFTPSLGVNTMMIALGGSYAYGTETEHSDLDIRGVALNTKKEILTGHDFEQVVDTNTDTTIYSFNKMLQLLCSMNPNTCEILGLEPWQYLYMNDIGYELLLNKKMFLSKLCIHTFGGYAQSQLRRLGNKAARLVGQTENEQYILKSIENAKYDFKSRYFPYNDGSINLYVDKSNSPELESEIYMDVNLNHYPLRDYAGMWNEMKSIVKSYTKIGKRNAHAIEHDKLGKHMCHLIRLYMMCIDILEKEEIITYRSNVKEHNLLMELRNGKYLDQNRQPTSDFYDVLNEYEKRFEYAKKNTSLPDKPDFSNIAEWKMSVNERIVRGDSYFGEKFGGRRYELFKNN